MLTTPERSTPPEVDASAAHALGATMLRRELLVEVEHDHIVVRITGTSYDGILLQDGKLDWSCRSEPAFEG
jgi:hypothetical protein